VAFEKYTVEQFKCAWFEKDYSVISEEEFKICHAEYLDTSGLFLSEDFERQTYIHHLHSRINYVNMFIQLQRDFLEEFGKPFIRDFDSFKQRWKDDKKDFENQLEKIEKRERKFHSILEEKIKEFNSEREKQKHKSSTEDDTDEELKKARLSFIRMINSLGKVGFTLDKDKTTVEELALMVKQQMEEIEEQNRILSNGR
jgi:hypothetical protein